MKAKQVRTLKEEGKTYDLYYKGIAVANITMEKGQEMNKTIALEIINQILGEQGLKPRKNPEKVEYKEANPKYKI